jgi:UDP-glucose 4-epimerase
MSKMTNASLSHSGANRMSRFLVTGGSGFVGAAVARKLATVGRVVIYDVVEPDKELSRCADYIRGDIRDSVRLRKAIAGCHAVFHFAGKLGVSQCQKSESLVRAVNVGGAEVLCNLIRDSETISTVVALSSSEVYGEGGNKILHEDDESQPLSVYGQTKVAVESLFRSLTQERNRHVVVIRPFNIYGPRQRRDFVVAKFCSDSVANKSITIFGTGQQTRTFTYIDDAVAGILGAYKYSVERGGLFDIFNIASRETVTIRTLAEMIECLGGSSQAFTIRNLSDSDVERDTSQEIMHRHPSIAKAALAFGYSPVVPLSQGIRKTLCWARTNLLVNSPTLRANQERSSQ